MPGTMLRHQVKPGITSWAQVSSWRGETDTVDKMQKRVECDLHTIRNWSLWLDVKIVALTVVRGFAGERAYWRRFGCGAQVFGAVNPRPTGWAAAVREAVGRGCRARL